MNDSDDLSPIGRIRIWDRIKAYASNIKSVRINDRSDCPPGCNILSIKEPSPSHQNPYPDHEPTSCSHPTGNAPQLSSRQETSGHAYDAEPGASHIFPGRSVPVAAQEREEASPIEPKERSDLLLRMYGTVKMIILSSWVNWLLLFVPTGIVLGIVHRSMGNESRISPSAIFTINAVAIIPLASMLGYATECVAQNLGDTTGALLNVTFGNAVELIIFIALVANQISILQASLLGSILANLLLILGMCFLIGGLRFREQLYNSAITQMSACLLALSVISLLLPTAFHASFSSLEIADAVVVKVSRGTSIVLLLVYILYLLFQLKSHAYIYESTPQHIIDEESRPGVLAEMLHPSFPLASDNSSDNDSDMSTGSNYTLKRIRKALRKKGWRKSSVVSRDTVSVPSMPSFIRTASSGSHCVETLSLNTVCGGLSATKKAEVETLSSKDKADTSETLERLHSSSSAFKSRDFEPSQFNAADNFQGEGQDKQPGWHKSQKGQKCQTPSRDWAECEPASSFRPPSLDEEGPLVSQISVSRKPSLPHRLASAALFLSAQQNSIEPGLRRVNSLPDRLSKPFLRTSIPSAQPLSHLVCKTGTRTKGDPDTKPRLSQVSAILMLLITTGLVAACAEFLVDSIDYLVESTGLSRQFIGLIILPIIGNAAEHVTAVTVASKNKMDLAIGVALGSSIQIALFVTPVIVLLAWCLDSKMSLYFSLFGTVSLFASAFIVNYLMLDGRSNYLEGALLIAAYVIIAVAAFFYPSCENMSSANGGPFDGSKC